MKYLIIMVSVLVVSCSPSVAAIQAAIAETEAARPTETVVPTATLTPSPFPSPFIPFVPTSNPSPTPDVRILIGSPIDFTLVREDFPDNYYLPRNWSTPHLNTEIVGVRGQEDGKAYIEATGRISGWIIWHKLNDSTKIAPERIESYVVMYESVEGPHSAVSPQWDYRPDEYDVINLEIELGDWTRVSVQREMQSNGRVRIWYQIEFIYRNIWASVEGYGWESDVLHDYLENLARIMLLKMEAAPLVKP